MEWVNVLMLWRTFRLFLLSLVTGICILVYSFAQGSFFWFVVSVVWIATTGFIFKRQWGKLKFQLRLLFMED